MRIGRKQMKNYIRKSGRCARLSVWKLKHRSSFIVYAVLRILVILVMVLQIFNGNFENVFFVYPDTVPADCTKFCAGRIQDRTPNHTGDYYFAFYISFQPKFWEKSVVLYSDSWLGYDSPHAERLSGSSDRILACRSSEPSMRYEFKLSRHLYHWLHLLFHDHRIIWEFFEFGMDTFFHMDMQKDTIITNVHSVLLNPGAKNVPWVE